MAGSSADAAAWTYKALAAAPMLTAALLASRLSRRPALALVLVGWNPALAIHFAGAVHNDAWMAALVRRAVALGGVGPQAARGGRVGDRRPGQVGAAPLLPLRALEARATGRPMRHLGLRRDPGSRRARSRPGATARAGSARSVPLPRNACVGRAIALPDRARAARRSRTGSRSGSAFARLAVGYAWLAPQAHRGRARLGLAAVPRPRRDALSRRLVRSSGRCPSPPPEDDDRLARSLALGLTAYLLRQTVPL